MNILLIISGSIAAYKSIEVVREFRKKKYELQCILSKCGEKFVSPLSLTSASGNYTYTDDDFFSRSQNMKHISLSRNSDLILVAPASADIMAKAAHGICDDLATTSLIASNIPVVMAPAMNVEMWKSRAVLRNLEILRSDNVHIIEPEEGTLVCGEEGYGKMASINTIVSCIDSTLSKKTP